MYIWNIFITFYESYKNIWIFVDLVMDGYVTWLAEALKWPNRVMHSIGSRFDVPNLGATYRGEPPARWVLTTRILHWSPGDLEQSDTRQSPSSLDKTQERKRNEKHDNTIIFVWEWSLVFCIVPNVFVYICPRYWEKDLFLRVTPGVHSPFRSLVAPTRSMHSRPSAHHTVVCFASTVPTSTPTPSRLRHVTSRE